MNEYLQVMSKYYRGGGDGGEEWQKGLCTDSDTLVDVVKGRCHVT